MKEEELELILKIFDESGDGTLSVAEILAWFESDPRFKSANFDMEKLTELSLQFQKYDTNGDGTLDRKEFALLFDDLEKSGITKGMNKVSVLTKIDVNRDGRISFKEYFYLNGRFTRWSGGLDYNLHQ